MYSMPKLLFLGVRRDVNVPAEPENDFAKSPVDFVSSIGKRGSNVSSKIAME